MKIGIISSGNDTLSLFSVLTKFNHSYVIFRDQTLYPFGSKDFNFIIKNLQKEIDFLRKKGAEKIILDPVYELYFLQDNLYKNQIFPLFSCYLQEFVFPFSLVGKIGILTDFSSREISQNLIAQEENKFSLTDKQQATKKFHFPFAYRVKAAGSRMYNIQDLGVHNPFLIKTMKNDLRYFKDAGVDTIIPLHYRFFQMQRTFKSFFNFHKIRFHDFSFIERSFEKVYEKIAHQKTENTLEYSLDIYSNQSEAFFLQEKKLLRTVTRGLTIPYQFSLID